MCLRIFSTFRFNGAQIEIWDFVIRGHFIEHDQGYNYRVCYDRYKPQLGTIKQIKLP